MNKTKETKNENELLSFVEKIKEWPSIEDLINDSFNFLSFYKEKKDVNAGLIRLEYVLLSSLEEIEEDDVEEKKKIQAALVELQALKEELEGQLDVMKSLLGAISNS